MTKKPIRNIISQTRETKKVLSRKTLTGCGPCTLWRMNLHPVVPASRMLRLFRTENCTTKKKCRQTWHQTLSIHCQQTKLWHGESLFDEQMINDSMISYDYNPVNKTSEKDNRHGLG